MVPFQLCINTTPHPRRLNYKGLGPSLGVLQLEETLNPKPYTEALPKMSAKIPPALLCALCFDSQGFWVEGSGFWGFRV